MRTHMDFVDDATAFFVELNKISLGLVKEGLNRSSSKLAAEYKAQIKNEQPSDWSSYSDKNKRRLTLQDKKKVFGQKYSKLTGKPIVGSGNKEENIADHIKWFTPKEMTALYAVIGGGHKTFYPIDYKNGIAVGFLSRQTGTARDTLEILDGLNDGKTIILSKKAQRFMATTLGLNGMPSKVVRIKARHFAERARAIGGQAAMETVAKLYYANFPQAVANISTQKVTMRTVS